MNTNLEIEYKQLLDQNTYFQMKKDYFEHVIPITQTNHYMTDQKGILSSLRYSLRVRELNHTYEFTLKVPQGFSKMEFNEMITKQQFHQLQNHEPFESQVLKELEKVNVSIQDLKVLTSLTTTRLEREYHGGTLCLDQSKYHGIVDYETEYEATSEEEGKALFVQLLQAYNINYTQNTPSKYARALKTL